MANRNACAQANQRRLVSSTIGFRLSYADPSGRGLLTRYARDWPVLANRRFSVGKIAVRLSPAHDTASSHAPWKKQMRKRSAHCITRLNAVTRSLFLNVGSEIFTRRQEQGQKQN